LKTNSLGYASLASHILFWLCLGWWEAVAGEAGSPLPDNGYGLLIQSRIAAFMAMLSLLISVACGAVVLDKECRAPVSSVISLLLLVPVIALWWSTITTNVF
jgi:hypothetical protein